MPFAHASDFVTERGWVEDPTGKMTLLEAEQAAQQPLDSDYFTKGFTSSVFWLRLHIDPQRASGKALNELVIRIRPPIQDQIQLFDPLAQRDRERLTGDYFDWAKDEYRSLNLNFVIPVGREPRDVWLRLQTHQSTMTMIEVMTMDEVRAADRRQELSAMLYFAVLIVCLGWAVLSYINERELLLGAYVVREVIAIAYTLVVLGFFRVIASGWLSPSLVDPISNYTLFAFVGYVIWFDSLLISEFKPNPWLIKLMRVSILVLPVGLMLFSMGKEHIAALLSSYLVFAVLFLALAAAISTKAWDVAKDLPPDQQPVFSKAFLVTMYSLVFVVVFINRLSAMGFATNQQMTLYLAQVYALLSSVCMMALVQIRAFRIRKRQADSQRRMELAQIEAAKERAQRIEQSNFLKMLAHEMKTPLSVVRMAVGNANLAPTANNLIDRAVTDMNSVIERLLEVERLQDQQITLRRTDFDLIALLHKTINALPGGLPRIKSVVPPFLTMNGDMRLVQVVLSNLLDNALKYSPSDAPVQVDVVADNEVIHITVENPKGTAGAPDPSRVFDKYYRSPRAHERTGSGLGLYLVRELVGMMGGHVSCTCKDDRVIFALTLPIR